MKDERKIQFILFVLKTFHKKWKGLLQPRPKHSILRSYIKWGFFVVAALLIKAKQQHGKNQNKNTGLFINCMDFVVVRTKINKK
jgi:hypothetical protein